MVLKFSFFAPCRDAWLALEKLLRIMSFSFHLRPQIRLCFYFLENDWHLFCRCHGRICRPSTSFGSSPRWLWLRSYLYGITWEWPVLWGWGWLCCRPHYRQDLGSSWASSSKPGISYWGVSEMADNLRATHEFKVLDLIQILPKCVVFCSPINNTSVLFEAMACCRMYGIFSKGVFVALDWIRASCQGSSWQVSVWSDNE